nr:TIGR02452 family protein [Nannocystis poenicansa]
MGKETVAIVDRGDYVVGGQVVTIADAVREAVAGTVLYRPEDFAAVPRPEAAGSGMTLEVWADTTGGAARRLVEEGASGVAALNFASAKNPGGGFLGGAKAQEEDLARCSALYHCLRSAPGYYTANRAEPSMLYTDHVIWSPGVPFFRDEQLHLLARPFRVGLVTAPAPNAGEHLHRKAGGRPAIRAALERRAERVLRVLAHQHQQVLVLGAWGCGVFRNDPAEVAEVFVRLLTAPPYAGAFTRVVFAIYDRSKDRSTLRAFERALTGA